MEDSHAIELELKNHVNSGFFAVFDGHGGNGASNYLSRNFHERINELSNVHSKNGMVNVALNLDRELEKSLGNSEFEGSTACFACVTKEETNYKITIGNVGDSRALLFTNRGHKPCITLTKDHLPDNKKEKKTHQESWRIDRPK